MVKVVGIVLYVFVFSVVGPALTTTVAGASPVTCGQVGVDVPRLPRTMRLSLRVGGITLSRRVASFRAWLALDIWLGVSVGRAG